VKVFKKNSTTSLKPALKTTQRYPHNFPFKLSNSPVVRISLPTLYDCIPQKQAFFAITLQACDLVKLLVKFSHKNLKIARLRPQIASLLKITLTHCGLVLKRYAEALLSLACKYNSITVRQSNSISDRQYIFNNYNNIAVIWA